MRRERRAGTPAGQPPRRRRYISTANTAGFYYLDRKARLRLPD